MAGKTHEMRRIAIEILENHPDGMRFKELVRAVSHQRPDFSIATIRQVVSNLCKRAPNRVYKPAQGLYRAVRFMSHDVKQANPLAAIREEDFYEPFAVWLESEIEDCTKAIPLGGNVFGDKWGTPDVIGKRESRKSDIIQAPIEIVSAEIKTNTQQLVTAFGQACAYCLFSHKAYLVVPKQTQADEVARLDSLCQVFGIGLVLFDAGAPDDPDFQIRVRPRYQHPDLFYANQYLKRIERELF